MTQLLVSVRNLEEAILAADAGVDLIDVKEPNLGSLGAASASTIDSILSQLSQSNSISIALGELTEIQSIEEFQSFTQSITSIADLSYAKIGLSEINRFEGWEYRWSEMMSLLPVSTGRVAVAYSDWQAAKSIPPAKILQFGIEQQCDAFLIDTYIKDGCSSLDHLTENELRKLIQVANESNILSVVAGSLSDKALERALQLKPDYVAVRGAACSEDRTSTICSEKLSQLVELVSKSVKLPAKDLNLS